jgi:CRP/FNR family transcriptional regulator
LLLELFVRSSAQWPRAGVEEMLLPVTQEQIGDATGLTGVHVNRVLARLSADGVLEFHYHRLKILDPDRLLEIADVSPQSAMSWIDDGSAI